MPKQRVLLVEDNKAYRRVLEKELIKQGFRPVVADNLQQTQSLLQTFEAKEFLVAVLDYCLPDAENGEVIDLVLATGLPVVVMTARMDDQVRDTVLSKPVLDYIPKDTPFCVDSLMPILRRLRDNADHLVVIADDSKTVRKHLKALLQRQRLRVLEAENGREALQLIQQHQDVSLLITDYYMPEMDGVRLIHELRRAVQNRVAAIGLSSSNERSLTAKFLKAGANDFLYKPFHQEEFYCRVNNMLNMIDSERRLYHLANTDHLTKCWNRRYFFSHPLACQENKPRALAVLDIDFFKQINDRYGHLAGDIVLVEFAANLRKHFPDALVSRFGGEEFCLLFGQTDQVFERLDALREQVAATPFYIGGTPIQFSFSGGLVCAQADIHDLVQQSDELLYQAKANGRNRIVYSDFTLLLADDE